MTTTGLVGVVTAGARTATTPTLSYLRAAGMNALVHNCFQACQRELHAGIGIGLRERPMSFPQISRSDRIQSLPN